MKCCYLLAVCSSLLLVGVLDVSPSGSARAQEIDQKEMKPARRTAEKFDEYGRVGHCDLTARLDNLAIQLQNEPHLKAHIVSFDASEKKSGYADWQLKQARFYLTRERGIDPARIVAVNGGRKDNEYGLTELWIVPEGAPPPVAAPETSKYTLREFSGNSMFTALTRAFTKR